MLFARSAQFHCNKFVTTLFKSLDDFTNQTTLDTVWFDSDKGTFSGHSRNKISIDYRSSNLIGGLTFGLSR